MKTKPIPFRVLETVTEYTRFYDLPTPLHPLLTVLDLNDLHRQPVDTIPAAALTPVVQQFYMISLKQGLGKAALRYGHQSYDFNEGVMSFLAPGQGCWLANAASAEALADIFASLRGWTLLVHADLLAKYPLGQKITRYGFFSYDTNEALHLSEAEEATMNQLIGSIRAEAERSVDSFSQDILVAQIDLLLTYADRFYHRQFLTRHQAEVNRDEDSLLSRFEARLIGYFAQPGEHPLPTVQSLADDLNVSPAYLSDTLRTQTGQNTQQHIHSALIEKAKRLLMSTSLSVNETAYQLGFKYPQYFSRLFKKKTGLTPAEFRFSMQ
ncbi:helix-turn-helix domain-containing protein [Larkinella sp. VNQ87]|uniref:helix-turn-helix domain-containing protein n=1 Tax=Larkinella sp. VNQ87 TaxID=3400921 RepID=UPI003BFD3302